ncbi:hypothetical protein Sru01_14590 [Sphaerisporangium rufum]|uniref:DUF397 domain-containing protein n=1 Tax=Sphaerisporangium rufum TaxID=1381558 RepID=A0A919R3Q2_9ACTN|nr:DUF397 domain-containing protein [Sphaerisporangium rufum]GII76477.1 hypothetical protein Sru01_14590 [Sphaerisporangium rufum]
MTATGSGAEIDLSQALWRRSSRSGDDGGMCVEAAVNLPGAVAVRDSKSPMRAPLITLPQEWRTFLNAVREEGLHNCPPA